MLKAGHWFAVVIMLPDMYDIMFQDLGLIPYLKAWEYQEKLLQQVITAKLQNEKCSGSGRKKVPGWFLFCEHPHVITLGKSGKEENLLAEKQWLEAKNVAVIRTNRGGDITYHGPGQIVGYPILDLDLLGIGIREYVHHLEESVIMTLAYFGIKGERLSGATGVWLDASVSDKARKICAIGVRASRRVTMHGFALNVNTDLSYFGLINPCGITGKAVTSMKEETGQQHEMNEVKRVLLGKFGEVFGIGRLRRQNFPTCCQF